MLKYSIVVPFHNEEDNVTTLYDRLKAVMEHVGETFDLVSDAVGGNFGTVDLDLDQPQLSLKHLGKFDVVLFSGVFYHLIDPIAATREVASLARELLIIETHVEITVDERPQMIFYPGAELSNDPTNWWGPNPACVVALLKQLGFARVYTLDTEFPNRKVFHAYWV